MPRLRRTKLLLARRLETPTSSKPSLNKQQLNRPPSNNRPMSNRIKTLSSRQMPLRATLPLPPTLRQLRLTRLLWLQMRLLVCVTSLLYNLR